MHSDDISTLIHPDFSSEKLSSVKARGPAMLITLKMFCIVFSVWLSNASLHGLSFDSCKGRKNLKIKKELQRLRAAIGAILRKSVQKSVHSCNMLTKISP